MGWWVEPPLAILITQLKAAHPGIVIGTIGDASHSSTTSDHNPDPDGSVDAADPMLGDHYTHDEAQADVDAIYASSDTRVKYLIWNRRIWNPSISNTWRTYTGTTDPHTGHWHISVLDGHRDDDKPWKIGVKRDMAYINIDGKLPILKLGDVDPVDDSGVYWVRRAQREIGVTADGIYGDDTKDALKKLMDNDTSTGKTIGMTEWRRLYGIWN